MFSGRELAVYSVGMLTLWPWHRSNTSLQSEHVSRTGQWTVWWQPYLICAFQQKWNSCGSAYTLMQHTHTHTHTLQLFLCSNVLLGPGTALSLPVLKPFHSCRGWVDYVNSRKLQLLNGNAVLNYRDGKRGHTKKKKSVEMELCTVLFAP